MTRNKRSKFLSVLVSVTLIFCLQLPASGATSYIEGTVKSISAKEIVIIKEDGTESKISMSKETAFYDSSKPCGPEAAANLKDIKPEDTAGLTVKILPDGNYSATGVIFLPRESRRHTTWEKIMNKPASPQQTVQNQPQNTYTQNNVSPQTSYGNSELVHVQGVVENITAAGMTIRTLEGQMITGSLYSETVVYDLSQGYNINSNSSTSNIRPGDVVGISYYKNSPDALIEAIMFLPQGTYFDESWQNIYNQIQEGSY